MADEQPGMNGEDVFREIGHKESDRWASNWEVF